MEIGDERWTALLAYCKLTELADDPEVLSLLPLMYGAAAGYMAGAGAPEPEDGPERDLYDLLVNRLTLDAWDRREITVTGTVINENPVFRLMMNQLKTGSGLGTLF